MGLSSGRERDRSGWGGALMQAADFGAVANLRVLLNARAATDLRDRSGKTALGYARQRRDRIGRVARACRCGRVVATILTYAELGISKNRCHTRIRPRSLACGLRQTPARDLVVKEGLIERHPRIRQRRLRFGHF